MNDIRRRLVLAACVDPLPRAPAKADRAPARDDAAASILRHLGAESILPGSPS